MSIGYPSRRRAKKAFERGVLAGMRGRPSHAPPYRNERLRNLWQRGWNMGRAGRQPNMHYLRPKGPAKAGMTRPRQHHIDPPQRQGRHRPVPRGVFGGGWRDA